MSRIARMLDDALEDLHRVDLVLVDRLARMREFSAAWPSGSGTTESHGARLVHWCWLHGREVERCHQEGDACDGEPLDAGHDPTGEAAIGGDKALAAHRRVERRVAALRRLAHELVRDVEPYGKRAATAEERRSTLATLERSESGGRGAEECWSCARTRDGSNQPRFSPGCRRVVVASDPRVLCRWCLDWFRELGELPTPAQVDAHARGARVPRPKSPNARAS